MNIAFLARRPFAFSDRRPISDGWKEGKDCQVLLLQVSDHHDVPPHRWGVAVFNDNKGLEPEGDLWNELKKAIPLLDLAVIELSGGKGHMQIAVDFLKAHHLNPDKAIFILAEHGGIGNHDRQLAWLRGYFTESIVIYDPRELRPELFPEGIMTQLFNRAMYQGVKVIKSSI